MMGPSSALLALGIAMTLSLPAAVSAKTASDKATSAKLAGKKPTRFTVHPQRYQWHGYGFLPGYRPQLAETNGLPVLGPDPRPKREIRYYDIYGNVRYGWGVPGFYRGRWNGGGFGPCWTSTPIGMIWNCGQ